MKTTMKPLMTEKASRLAGQSTYTFRVDGSMNKYQIVEVVEKMYKVKVSQVKVAKQRGKVRRVGKLGRSKQLPDKKIAYVTLKEGQIDVFPQA
jgi:large subunit ribosomal protein L23